MKPVIVSAEKLRVLIYCVFDLLFLLMLTLDVTMGKFA